MAENFPGPYELRIQYDTQLTYGRHIQRLNIDLTADPEPGPTTFAELTVVKNVGNTPLNTAVEAYLTLFRQMFNTAVDIGPITLWKYTPLTYESTFVTVYEPVIVSGTSGSATQQAGQAIITFYTEEGGILKLNFMESTHAHAADQAFPTNVSVVNNIADFVTGDDGFFIGRDTSRVLARKGWFPGINEALWKKYNRTT